MPSFEMIYEDDEDVLEVTFADFDESFSRSIALNDNIVLHTDLAFNSALGLTFYSYSQLLQVHETEFDGLEAVSPADREPLFALLARFPAVLFLNVVDAEHLRAQVRAPHLEQLVRPRG